MLSIHHTIEFLKEIITDIDLALEDLPYDDAYDYTRAALINIEKAVAYLEGVEDGSKE